MPTQCFMPGCDELATVEDACPLHASSDQLRRVVPRLLAQIEELRQLVKAEGLMS